MDRWLAPTWFVDSDHPALQHAAADLAARHPDPPDLAVALFYAVRDGLRYNPWVKMWRPEVNRASHAWLAGEGYCVQKACTLVALARACGIPARLGLADIRNHRSTGELRELMGTDIFICHGYAELHLDNRWVKATPAFNQELCLRMGYHVTEFDGRHDANLPANDLAGRPHIEYITTHGTFADLPFDFICGHWLSRYPRAAEWFAGTVTPEPPADQH